MAKREILNVSINDDGNLFVVCMDNGIRIYNMEPLVGKLFIDSSIIGSVSICKLLHRTNLIALVGGGDRPKFADNTVLIWDDSLKKFVLEFTFANRVLSLRARRDRLFVVERFRIHCFSFPNKPQKLFSIETRDNPLGICEITPWTSATEIQLLVYPGHRIGSVQILDLSHTNQVTSINLPLDRTSNNKQEETINSSVSRASTSISPSSISAHTSDIASIALNRTGTLLATASRKGTLIRIFRTMDSDVSIRTGSNNRHYHLSPAQIVEFRRGIDQAMVYGIVFSPDSEYVLVSSDKGTVHIYALKDTKLNRRSTLSSVPLVNINTASYDFAKFTLAAECACVCSFGEDRRSVYAVCVDGTFHKYLFKNDGTCLRDNYDIFLNVPEEADHILL